MKLDGLTPNFNQKVLISVNSLIDIDIGLLLLIQKEYLDPSVFDVSYFKKSTIIDFIKTTYYRSEGNPLYSISVIKDHKLLDSYYMEFFQTSYEQIYDMSVYTDVLSMIELFLETNEISVDVLYYKDYSITRLAVDQALGKLPESLKFISINDLKSKEFNEYNQVYLRSVTEFDVLPVKSLISPKSFYISSFGPNFSETGRIKRSKGLNDIMTSKLMHEIAIFDMYSNKNIQYKKEDKNKE